ncbi:MAG TPA: PH domain-containing protein [Flavitalea sp.]|nr:PH domain-containing protein [Flavitalea sp.]
MTFLNDNILLSSIPKLEEVQLRPINKEYKQVLLIEWVISSLILLVIAIGCIVFIHALYNGIWKYIIPTVLLAGILFRYFLITKSFRMMAYAIREKDLLYRNGWIIQKIRTCPFNRVQHSSVSSGPLERRYKLATLVLYTAGTDEADLHIPGLSVEEAGSLKEWINKKVINEI